MQKSTIFKNFKNKVRTVNKMIFIITSIILFKKRSTNGHVNFVFGYKMFSNWDVRSMTFCCYNTKNLSSKFLCHTDNETINLLKEKFDASIISRNRLVNWPTQDHAIEQHWVFLCGVM